MQILQSLQHFKSLACLQKKRVLFFFVFFFCVSVFPQNNLADDFSDSSDENSVLLGDDQIQDRASFDEASAQDPDEDSVVLDQGNASKEDNAVGFEKGDASYQSANERVSVAVESFELIEPLDVYSQSVHAGFGLMSNRVVGSKSLSRFFAVNMGFESVVWNAPFFEKPSLQDAFAVELGSYYYTLMNFYYTSDAFQIFSPYINVKYKWNFSSDLAVFSYVQMANQFVVSSAQSSSPYRALEIATFEGVLLDIGVGLFYQFGPGWYARLKLGVTSMDVAMALRF